ncbi:hypothetical protein ACFV2N_45850 [Streptomyces sp. NPDC059680]
MTRVQLADKEWEFIEPYLPTTGRTPRPIPIGRSGAASDADANSG